MRELTVMRKNKLLALLCAVAALLGGCSDSNETYQTMDMSKYIKVGEYKGLSAHQNYYAVEEDELNLSIEANLSDYAEKTDINTRPLKTGDYVYIDMKGSIDGVAIDEISSDEFLLWIGSNNFTDAEQAVIGLKIGESVSFQATYGEDVDNEKIAGKTADFTVTVLSAYVYVYPEFTDEFIFEAVGYETYEEYVDSLRIEMREYYDDLAVSEVQRELWVAVCTSSELIKYPKKQYKAAKEKYKSQYEDIAATYGLTVDEMLETYGDKLGLTADGIEEGSEMYAADVVYEDLVMYTIVNNEGLTLSEEEYQKRAKEYIRELVRNAELSSAEAAASKTSDLANYYQSSETSEEDTTPHTVAELEQLYGYDYVYQTLLYDVVLEFIYDNANIEYSEYYNQAENAE